MISMIPAALMCIDLIINKDGVTENQKPYMISC